MKFKSLIKTLVFSHVRRAFRSLSAAKSKTLHLIFYEPKHKKKNKIFFGSFRFHYNWCSSKRHSHVLPVPAPVFDGLPSYDASHSYYDSTWHSTIPTSGRFYADEYHGQNGNYNPHESQLYGYLQWLEEKRLQDKASGGNADRRDDDHHHQINPTVDGNDIDKLADLFIANSHAKFILEKQESARRFKEMLERSA